MASLLWLPRRVASTYAGTQLLSRSWLCLLHRNCSSTRPMYRSRFIHRNSRTLLYIMHLREWDSNLERELALCGITLTQNIVDQVMGCIPSPKLALQFFIWSGEKIGYPSPTSRAWYDITEWYAHKSHTLSFLNILRCRSSRPHYYLSPSKINVLLQGYGWAGMLDRSYKVLMDTQSFYNSFLVNCFLVSVLKEHQYDMVHDVYVEMQRCNTPIQVCFNSLIYGMANSSVRLHWNAADALYREMVLCGQFPNEDSCNSLTVAMSNAQNHERACELMQDMRDRNIVPQRSTYYAVAECLCHSKDLQKASHLLEEMKQHGYKPNPKIYNAILTSL